MTSPVPTPSARHPGAAQSSHTPWYSRRNCWNSGRDTRQSSGRSPALWGRRGSTWQPAGWRSLDGEGPLGRQSPAPGQHSCPKGSSMAHPLPLPPTYTGRDQGRTPPPHFKPNLRALASKKGRSICRRQNLVSPGRPRGKRAFRKKGWGKREGQASRRRAGEMAPKSPQAGQRG